jgi:hypothetical protein
VPKMIFFFISVSFELSFNHLRYFKKVMRVVFWKVVLVVSKVVELSDIWSELPWSEFSRIHDMPTSVCKYKQANLHG